VYRHAGSNSVTAFEVTQKQILRPLRGREDDDTAQLLRGHQVDETAQPLRGHQNDRTAPSEAKSSGASASPPLPPLPQSSAHDVAQTVRALANAGRLAEAGRACAAALDRYRENAELHYLHAILLAEGGQFAESARAAKRALYLERDMIVAHLALGSALLREDEMSGARRSFANAERLLAAMPIDAVVPYTDGEPAGRLLEMTRVRAKLAGRTRAA
jgi:chemotaxis protein methyltransferase CheR